MNWTQLLEFIYNLVIYQLAPANEMVQAILIMQGCQMTLPLGKVARYDITIYNISFLGSSVLKMGQLRYHINNPGLQRLKIRI